MPDPVYHSPDELRGEGGGTAVLHSPDELREPQYHSPDELRTQTTSESEEAPKYFAGQQGEMPAGGAPGAAFAGAAACPKARPASVAPAQKDASIRRFI